VKSKRNGNKITEFSSPSFVKVKKVKIGARIKVAIQTFNKNLAEYGRIIEVLVYGS